ncbi:peptidoglycan-binding protein [Streptomyces sp. NPDC048242]|uniref:peptidoglycan-binding protein n=1 Tax=Streptomyces sp. NPDC048242 TaxID=3155026 RepID=UPI00342CC78C
MDRTHERGGPDGESSAGVRLALLLRRWWEETGSSSGGTRPTQQALATRLGVDQTTLSRYLNPKHLSAAPLRVIDALHAQLRAPAAELEQARALCRAAQRENSRQRRAAPAGASDGGSPAGAADGGTPMGAAVPGEAAASAFGKGHATTRGKDRVGTLGRLHSSWLPPVLIAAAMVLAFTAGMVVHRQLSAQDHVTMANGPAGAAPASQGPYTWPLLRVGEDCFARGRALQYLLRARGYRVPTDGFFGEDTRKAAITFQRREEIPADGKVGGLTWPRLVMDVKLGSGSYEVRAVQELLANVNRGDTPVSGRFDTETAEQVRHFQHEHGLRATGRVEKNTWLALLVKQLPPAHAPDYQRTMVPLPSASE